MFPETKRLSAEDASRVFDYDSNGHLWGQADHSETGSSGPEDEKEYSRGPIEDERKS